MANETDSDALVCKSQHGKTTNLEPALVAFIKET